MQKEEDHRECNFEIRSTQAANPQLTDRARIDSSASVCRGKIEDNKIICSYLGIS